MARAKEAVGAVDLTCEISFVVLLIVCMEFQHSVFIGSLPRVDYIKPFPTFIWLFLLILLVLLIVVICSLFSHMQ